MLLANKVFMVTGGCGCLGGPITGALAAEGATVCVLDVDEVGLRALEKVDGVYPYACDVTDMASIELAVEQIIARFEKIHGLINGAGLIYNESIFSFSNESGRHSFDSWDRVIELNMSATFRVSSVVLEHMVLNRTKGVVVNIGSISSRGNPGQTAYSAAKAGVEAMANVWAQELGPLGIRAFTISPGFINTNSTSAALSSAAVQKINERVPLRRLGSASEVSTMLLAAIANDYVTGVTIPIHGGIVV